MAIFLVEHEQSQPPPQAAAKNDVLNIPLENTKFLVNLPLEHTNTLHILNMFKVLSENNISNLQPDEIRKNEVKQIRNIYEIFHNCQSTELFYKHVKNYNDIRITELILDTTFEWEIFEAHCSNKCEAIGLNHLLL